MKAEPSGSHCMPSMDLSLNSPLRKMASRVSGLFDIPPLFFEILKSQIIYLMKEMQLSFIGPSEFFCFWYEKGAPGETWRK